MYYFCDRIVVGKSRKMRGDIMSTEVTITSECQIFFNGFPYQILVLMVSSLL